METNKPPHSAKNTTTIQKESAPDPTQTVHTEEMYVKALPQNKDGQVVEGVVISMDKREVVIDVNLKADGIVSLSEFKSNPDLKVGDKVIVYVEKQENRHGALVVSHKKAKLIQAWANIERAEKESIPITITILRKTKGGLIGSYQGIQVFLPGSQISIAPVKDFDIYVDEEQKMEVAVIKINQVKCNVVVSHKVLIEKDLRVQRKEIMKNLQIGQVLEGIIKNVKDFGAFVDVGGLVGLVHKKYMCWNLVPEDPETLKDKDGNLMFEKDKKIRVAVIGFDEEKEYLSLSTRELEPNPWDQLGPEVVEGATVEGKVVKILTHGAEVEILPEVRAFLHSADMTHSTYRINSEDVVSIGQDVKGEVIGIDRHDRQNMRISMKALLPNPWEAKDFMQKYGLDTRHEALVRRFKEDGAFLELAPGVEGFLHKRSLSWIKKAYHPSEVLQKGEKVQIVVLGIDEEERLLGLGYREVEESPWDNFEEIFQPNTIHKGTIIKLNAKGAVAEFAYGLQSFIPAKDIEKKDKSEAVVGEVLDFVVTDFLKYDNKVYFSHAITYQKPHLAGGSAKDVAKYTPKKVEKSVMGDIEALSLLKKKLEKREANKDKDNNKKDT